MLFQLLRLKDTQGHFLPAPTPEESKTIQCFTEFLWQRVGPRSTCLVSFSLIDVNIYQNFNFCTLLDKFSCDAKCIMKTRDKTLPFVLSIKGNDSQGQWCKANRLLTLLKPLFDLLWSYRAWPSSLLWFQCEMPIPGSCVWSSVHSTILEICRPFGHGWSLAERRVPLTR